MTPTELTSDELHKLWQPLLDAVPELMPWRLRYREYDRHTPNVEAGWWLLMPLRSPHAAALLRDKVMLWLAKKGWALGTHAQSNKWWCYHRSNNTATCHYNTPDEALAAGVRAVVKMK